MSAEISDCHKQNFGRGLSFGFFQMDRRVQHHVFWNLFDPRPFTPKTILL